MKVWCWFLDDFPFSSLSDFQVPAIHFPGFHKILGTPNKNMGIFFRKKKKKN